MQDQNNLGKRKGPDHKIWVILGIILVATVIVAVTAMLVKEKKKSDGNKIPAATEKSEEPDEEVPRKVVDSSTSGTSKVPEDEEPNKDQSDGKDFNTQTYDEDQTAVGMYVVYLNGWIAAQRDGGLYLTKNGEEIWRDPGEHAQSMMLTNDGLFYVTGEGGSELNYS